MQGLHTIRFLIMVCRIPIKIGVILAAGRGTRIFNDQHQAAMPKAMLDIGGMPILERAILMLKRIGIKKIYIIVNYKKDVIINYIKNENFFNTTIVFVKQKKLNGTANAILLLKKHIKEPFLVILGDCVFNIYSWSPLFLLQKKYKPIAIQGVTHCGNKKTLKGTNEVFLNGNIIKKIIEKPKRPTSKMTGTGIYLFTSEIFDYIEKTKINPIRNELEITDTIDAVAKIKRAYAWFIEGKVFNINTNKDLNLARRYSIVHKVDIT